MMSFKSDASISKVVFRAPHITRHPYSQYLAEIIAVVRAERPRGTMDQASALVVHRHFQALEVIHPEVY